MGKSSLLIGPGLKRKFRGAIVLNIFQFILRGMPFGFLMLVLSELFAEDIDTDRIIIYFVSMLVLLLINLWVAIIADAKLNTTSFQISGDLRLRLGEHLRKLSLGFFKRNDPGDITATLLQDMKNFESIFSRFYPNVISAVVIPSLVIVFLLAVDLRLCAILSAFVLLSIPALILSNKRVEKLGGKVVALRTSVSSMILEYFSGMKVLKAHRMRGEKFERLDNKMYSLRKENIKMEAFLAPFIFSYMAVLDFGFIAVLLFGTSYISNGDITPTLFLLFLVIGNRIFDVLQGLGVFIVMMRYMQVAEKRIASVLKEQPLPEKSPCEKLKGFDIEFKDVIFGYIDRMILKGISFKAQENSLTALVGPSGSGKTTITSLIARFWDTNSGEIKIGGTDIRNIGGNELLSNISIIFQDVYLFNDSVFNNIKMGRKDATYEEVIEAAKAAQCDEFVSKMPKGYDSVVGEGGAKLSQGQRQRISIARAVLKDAPIVLLDEATASLDPENEKLIQNAINKLIDKKTLIVIAHRLPTIVHADRIIVLNEGEIVEQGRHDELLKNDGLYRNLWEKQNEAKGWTF